MAAPRAITATTKPRAAARAPACAAVCTTVCAAVCAAVNSADCAIVRAAARAAVRAAVGACARAAVRAAVHAADRTAGRDGVSYCCSRRKPRRCAARSPGEHILAAIVLAAARGAALVFVILVLAPLNRLAAAPAAEMRAGAMWWC